jgi:hypothetical protein
VKTAPTTGSSLRDATLATATYTALALVMTWPLVRGLTHDIAGDLGDPLLNTWILAWDADHIWRALTGHPSALAGYWNANIFYPHPLSLAYSEHLTAQAIQILPVYVLSGNPILCYNALFLSTFVLSGLGMFLLVRELTDSRSAAFIGGLAYAFAPYRFGSIPHLQVLSSAWMPLALLGFRRFFETRRLVPLAVGAAAWIVQNLSCGYYLMYFSPSIALYIVWEITTKRLWRAGGMAASLASALLVVGLATLPFVLPYVELRRLGFGPRSLHETNHFAADVYAYLTADPNLRLWGPILQFWPSAENALFPGGAILILAGAAVLISWRDAARLEIGSGRLQPAQRVRLKADTTSTLTRMLAVPITVIGGMIVARLLGWSLRSFAVKATSLDRLLLVEMMLVAALLASSARARSIVSRWVASPAAILTGVTLFAVVMSFGPYVHARGRLVEDPNLYAFFFDYAPGFDGLRVPARFGMIVALGLATLAGCGVGSIRARRSRWLLAGVAGAVIVIESIAIPLTINYNPADYRQSGLMPLPGVVATGGAAPPVYRFVGSLPGSAVLLELPFGEPAFDVRFMFFSTLHWRRLVNGYSGGAPVEYGLITERLKDWRGEPDAAWQTLFDSGATYCIVHEWAYTAPGGRQLSDWLRTRGAREVAAFGDDHVFEVRHSF